MSYFDEPQRNLISRNTTISLGLGMAVASMLFFGGREIGQMEMRMTSHEELEIHHGSKGLYVPRDESNIWVESVDQRIINLERQQTEILLRLSEKN